MNSNARPPDPPWDDPPDDDYLAATTSAALRLNAIIAQFPEANNPIYDFPPDDNSLYGDDPNEPPISDLSTHLTCSSDLPPLDTIDFQRHDPSTEPFCLHQESLHYSQCKQSAAYMTQCASTMEQFQVNSMPNLLATSTSSAATSASSSTIVSTPAPLQKHRYAFAAMSISLRYGKSDTVPVPALPVAPVSTPLTCDLSPPPSGLSTLSSSLMKPAALLLLHHQRVPCLQITFLTRPPPAPDPTLQHPAVLFLLHLGLGFLPMSTTSFSFGLLPVKFLRKLDTSFRAMSSSYFRLIVK